MIKFALLTSLILASGNSLHGNNIIAMSVFGNKSVYINGCLANANIVLRFWPGWKLRVYHQNLSPNIIRILVRSKCEVVRVGPSLIPGVFWRFLVFADIKVSRFIIRDCDARLSFRDRAAVREWVESALPFHIMHDHPQHLSWPILAGMWGAVGGQLSSHHTSTFQFIKENYYGIDQDWLTVHVWPLAANNSLIHASYGCEQYRRVCAHVRPFPTMRTDLNDFVGNVYGPDNNWKGHKIDTFGDSSVCPAGCRRKAHWTIC